jgi:hypothetical protein
MLDDVDHELRKLNPKNYRCGDPKQDQVEVNYAFQHDSPFLRFRKARNTRVS